MKVYVTFYSVVMKDKKGNSNDSTRIKYVSRETNPENCFFKIKIFEVEDLYYYWKGKNERYK